MKRMSMRRFCKIVRKVLDHLPEEFYPHMANLVVDVVEEPDHETLKSAGLTDEEIEAGESLYGLCIYQESELGLHGEGLDIADLPRKLLIFKNPLEEDFPDRKQLLIEIRRTVIHELSHHFGFTEKDLERFESREDPFGDDLTEKLDE